MRSAARYVPAVVLMGLIFLVSAQSNLPSAESSLDVALRKAAHMTEFGLLWGLWLWALPGSRPRAARAALAIALAYAVGDEVHQAFVATRHPSPFDVAIDAAGMGVAAATWVLRTRGASPPTAWSSTDGAEGQLRAAAADGVLAPAERAASADQGEQHERSAPRTI